MDKDKVLKEVHSKHKEHREMLEEKRRKIYQAANAVNANAQSFISFMKEMKVPSKYIKVFNGTTGGGMDTASWGTYKETRFCGWYITGDQGVLTDAGIFMTPTVGYNKPTDFISYTRYEFSTLAVLDVVKLVEYLHSSTPSDKWLFEYAYYLEGLHDPELWEQAAAKLIYDQQQQD